MGSYFNLEMKNIKIKIMLGGIVLLVLANFFVWREVWGLGGGLEVVFFDVGQGDSAFVETPEGHQILIDSGPSGEVILEKLSQEMPFWDRTLDLIVLTHPDYDHQRGFLDVLDRYKVENILWHGGTRETKTYLSWLEKIEQEQANIFMAQKDQQIRVGDSQFFIFHPFESLEGVSVEKKSNESSIIMKLVYGSNSFLFTGDVSKDEEEALLVRSDLPVGIGAQVLKIAHHGSKTSSSKQFLQVVNPEFAIISAGKDNQYGHPAKETLNSLKEFAIKVLRTDEFGDIRIVATGNNLLINQN